MQNKNEGLKPRLDLLDPEFVEGLGMVLAHGAQKYGTNNWRTVEDGINEFYAAAMRHLLAWRRGEMTDPEWGMHHLLHAACNIYFLEALTRVGVLYTKSPSNIAEAILGPAVAASEEANGFKTQPSNDRPFYRDHNLQQFIDRARESFGMPVTTPEAERLEQWRKNSQPDEPGLYVQVSMNKEKEVDQPQKGGSDGNSGGTDQSQGSEDL